MFGSTEPCPEASAHAERSKLGGGVLPGRAAPYLVGMTAPAEPALTVYYDGACPLCAAEIRLYRRAEGAERVAWIDVGAEGPADLGPGLTRSAARARFHVRRPDGALVSGAAGFAALWAVLPRWRGLARLAALPGVTRLGEVAYRLFLPLRPWIARFVPGGGPRCGTACG